MVLKELIWCFEIFIIDVFCVELDKFCLFMSESLEKFRGSVARIIEIFEEFLVVLLWCREGDYVDLLDEFKNIYE